MSSSRYTKIRIRTRHGLVQNGVRTSDMRTIYIHLCPCQKHLFLQLSVCLSAVFFSCISAPAPLRFHFLLIRVFLPLFNSRPSFFSLSFLVSLFVLHSAITRRLLPNINGEHSVFPSFYSVDSQTSGDQQSKAINGSTEYNVVHALHHGSLTHIHLQLTCISQDYHRQYIQYDLEVDGEKLS